MKHSATLHNPLLSLHCSFPIQDLNNDGTEFSVHVIVSASNTGTDALILKAVNETFKLGISIANRQNMGFMVSGEFLNCKYYI